MKTRFFIILALCLLGTSLWAQSKTQYIQVKQENLRTEPNGKKIAELGSGTAVQVLETQGEWTKVQMTGWIWKSSLTDDPTRVTGFKVQVSHILCKDEATAQALLARLQKGEDFVALAKAESQDQASAAAGGDLGMFGRGDLLPEFEDVAFKLKVNEISAVLKTPVGYHIIKRTK